MGHCLPLICGSLSHAPGLGIGAASGAITTLTVVLVIIISVCVLRTLTDCKCIIICVIYHLVYFTPSCFSNKFTTTIHIPSCAAPLKLAERVILKNHIDLVNFRYCLASF